jgi:hypothetical protein
MDLGLLVRICDRAMFFPITDNRQRLKANIIDRKDSTVNAAINELFDTLDTLNPMSDLWYPCLGESR